jgi:prepilin-type N-terminal cleavage/methylation domain-containing protein
MRFFHKHIHGFSLVEVIIVSAILLLVFGGLFSSFKYTLGLIANSKAKMTALALITDRLEYIRSLPYDAVGTIGGLPNRSIPQYRIIEQPGVVL